MDNFVNELIRNMLLFFNEIYDYIGVKYFLLMIVFGLLLLIVPSKTAKTIGQYLVYLPIVFWVIYIILFIAVFFTFGPEG